MTAPDPRLPEEHVPQEPALEIEAAARSLPDSLATFFYADDPVVPLIHRLWRALGRELPATCLCSFCDPIHDTLVGVQP